MIPISGPVANAFGHTFLWALLMALVTIVPGAVLIHAERIRRQQKRHRPGNHQEPTDRPPGPCRVMYGPSASNRRVGHDIPSTVVERR
jgi:hypothetical protein